jgi:DNA-binding NtrC family response regulator
MLESYLASAGIYSVTSQSAESASAILKEKPIDILIVDWRLGGKYGAEVIDIARSMNPLLPVIVISGQSTIDVATEALVAGADNFIQKPFSATLLVRIVSLWLKRIERMKGPFLPTKVEDIIPFERLKQKYFRAALELAGSVTRASELLNVDRQTVSATVKKASTEDSN